MADAKIAVERLVHDSIARLLEDIQHEHHVQIKTLTAHWADYTQVHSTHPVLNVVRIEMTTVANQPWNPEKETK